MFGCVGTIPGTTRTVRHRGSDSIRSVETFRGAFEDLQARVDATGCTGSWSDLEHGKQFKGDDGAVLNWFKSTGKLQYQGAQAARTELKRRLSEGTTAGPSAAATASAKPAATAKKVFVVHGHDATAREQLEFILHKLQLDPFVLANTGGGGLTIIEALEKEIGTKPGSARFGIVLMTPDDVGYAKAVGPEKAEPRPRQNVVLETGMLIAALGRPNVVILKKGHLEIPSDAGGIIYIGFNDHVREAVPKLVDRLRAAGFDVDADCITRASA